jgi:hypothetical protein
MRVQYTICDDCGNSILPHDGAVWTADGASYCPSCRPSLVQNLITNLNAALSSGTPKPKMPREFRWPLDEPEDGK